MRIDFKHLKYFTNKVKLQHELLNCVCDDSHLYLTLITYLCTELEICDHSLEMLISLSRTHTIQIFVISITMYMTKCESDTHC